jgi:hypothetical protein
MNNLTRQIDLTGGESVYCINTFQMEKAQELFSSDSEEAERVQNAVATLERDLTRNERATLAMMLLRRLKADPS